MLSVLCINFHYHHCNGWHIPQRLRLSKSNQNLHDHIGTNHCKQEDLRLCDCWDCFCKWRVTIYFCCGKSWNYHMDHFVNCRHLGFLHHGNQGKDHWCLWKILGYYNHRTSAATNALPEDLQGLNIKEWVVIV